ncbi:unnamed protein product [Lupinus luteus]|uniref:DUF4283 domain-containing protein n=1 Tax=Lupinus luteus TaxID=3873 RepID=A0AAV1W7T1_LUPLU
MKDAEQWFSDNFLEVIPWSSEVIPASRDVWIHCSGVPVHAWCSKMFELIANEVGTLVVVNEASLSKEKFETCRLRIRTSSKVHIEKVVAVLVDDLKFEVAVWEEFSGVFTPSLFLKDVEAGGHGSSEDEDEFSEFLSEWVSDSLDSVSSPKETGMDGSLEMGNESIFIGGGDSNAVCTTCIDKEREFKAGIDLGEDSDKLLMNPSVANDEGNYGGPRSLSLEHGSLVGGGTCCPAEESKGVPGVGDVSDSELGNLLPSSSVQSVIGDGSFADRGLLKKGKSGKRKSRNNLCWNGKNFVLILVTYL